MDDVHGFGPDPQVEKTSDSVMAAFIAKVRSTII